ncbi:CBS domain-containing protein [Polaribacter aquimarinus]|uniref:CBS domain-containing protein n=1 Tax=Polaribacter aquimarinus TaxID=2100726 RepID=A0A2U2J7X4_9FLAO|nr:CBS domain-containing protein [Polaribacter aquimarinus]PWG04438.1 CBS domain-containing protein [Polaribacter aquimarinus]
MGSQSVTAIKTQKERKNFVRHLLNDIEAFEYMIQNNLFETGVQRVGAEQEICIVDKDYRPSTNALKILDKINDDHYTTELALFNLEINLNPYKLEKKCFSEIEKQLTSLLNKGYRVAEATDNNKLILTGILPTLRKKDLVFKNVTPYKRYKTLNNVIKKIRGDDFKLHIQGVDELILKHKSILFEACNTSFQVHLQISPEEAIDKYNWSQAIAGPLLSIMTNSPLLLGRELWSETRIALFQQSIDLRNVSHFSREQKPRVSFGTDWVKDSILELFTDDISRYPPIVSSEFDEDSVTAIKKGIMPKLKALNLHNGTLYKWNRLCYGVHQNVAHLRIENRYIPSGPSVKDEIANAMLWVGVMQGMPRQYEKIWRKMPFYDAKGNFINAARTGINTYFSWFGKGISAKKLLENILIPMAKEGLLKSNVDEGEIDYYLNIIQKRIDKSTTGSKWLIRNKRKLRKEVSKYESHVILTEHIYKNQQLNIPISEWESIDVHENDISKKYDKVYKIMSTGLFVVHENDLLQLAYKIMKWKNIHHIPVVDKNNFVVGVLEKKQLDNLDFTSKKIQNKVAKNIMTTNYDIVESETSYKKIKELIETTDNTSVIVLNDKKLVGIFTKSDLERIEKIKKSK